MKSFSKISSFVLLVFFLCFNFFVRISFIPFRIWDEARNANNAFHMYLHGNWLVPYYEGSPDMWNTKPPLLIWLQVIDMHVFGVNEWAVRLPSALAALATGLLLWWFCKKHFQKPWMGFLTGAVFAFTPAYVYNHGGRTGDYDALMIFFMVSYCFCFFEFTQSDKKKWLYLFWGFVTLAALTKGVAGLTLLPGLVLFALVQKKVLPLLKNPAFYLGSLLFLFIVGGYYLIREQYNSGYLQAVYDNELGGRYLQSLEGHQHPFWYYYENMKEWRYSYWLYFILPAFIIVPFNSEPLAKKFTLFNFLMVIPLWIILSYGGTKLEWYELPLYPFLALQIGTALYTVWEWTGALLKNKAAKTIIGVLAFAGIFFVPCRDIMHHIFSFEEKPWDVEPHQQSYFLQERIRQKGDLDNYVFCYAGYNGQINIYIQKLQAEKINLRLQPDVRDIRPGQYVVVSQEDLKQQLLNAYRVKKLDEKFGCSVYLVQPAL